LNDLVHSVLVQGSNYHPYPKIFNQLCILKNQVLLFSNDYHNDQVLDVNLLVENQIFPKILSY